MKITDVRTCLLATPYRRLDPPSPWADGLRKQLLVRVATDEGLVGWGEAFALGAPRAVAEVVDINEEALRRHPYGAGPQRPFTTNR